jgi:hypothetical protein
MRPPPAPPTLDGEGSGDRAVLDTRCDFEGSDNRRPDCHRDGRRGPAVLAHERQCERLTGAFPTPFAHPDRSLCVTSGPGRRRPRALYPVESRGYSQKVRGGRVRGRYIVAAAILVGLLIEIPLLAYIFTNGDDPAPVAAQQNTLGGASRSLPLHPTAGTFKPDDTTLLECSEQTCFEQAYGNIAYNDGPKRAFALAEEQYPGGADPNCHRVAHAIGAAALARNKGDVTRTFAEGSSTCWSGYYHGVLERAFVGVKSYDARSLGAKARGLCSQGSVRASSWLNYQCLHGLGHGLMITTGYQLPLVLDVCNELDGGFAQTSCKGGVFMENILTSYGGQSPWVRNDDALYPCNWVARGDKFPCYQNAVTRIIRVVGTEWNTIAETCAEADKGFVETCFGSYGQNASVVAFRKPAAIVETCAIARPHEGEEECFRYAAMDFTGTYSRGKEAAALCDMAPRAVRGGCYESIGIMLGRLKPTGVAQQTECRAVASSQEYAAQCLKGLTLRSPIPGLAR